MKRISVVIIALVALVATSATASAQLFRYGIRAGVNVNSLHFSDKLIDSHNRMGYTAGIVGEFNLPVLPFAVDASLMFSHRNYNLTTEVDGQKISESKGANYLEIPVHFRWNISIPAVSSFVMPYLYTGPDFAFLLGKTKVYEGLKRKNADIDWNFGFGLELIRHLQLSAHYSIGLSKAYSGEAGSGRTRCWTVTAAYIF